MYVYIICSYIFRCRFGCSLIPLTRHKALNFVELQNLFEIIRVSDFKFVCVCRGVSLILIIIWKSYLYMLMLILNSEIIKLIQTCFELCLT